MINRIFPVDRPLEGNTLTNDRGFWTCVHHTITPYIASTIKIMFIISNIAHIFIDFTSNNFHEHPLNIDLWHINPSGITFLYIFFSIYLFP